MASGLRDLMKSLRVQKADIRARDQHLIVFVDGKPVARFPRNLKGTDRPGSRHENNNLSALRRAGFDV